MSLRSSPAFVGAMVLVTPRVPPARNGVGDYTYVLGKELAKKGPVVIVTSAGQRGEERDGFAVWPVVRRWDFAGLRRLRAIVPGLQPSVINLQWVPFLWGRWGINVALPPAVVALRRAGFRVVTTVHEPYVPLDTWGRRLYGPVQRLELAVIASASARVVATTPIFADLLRTLVPRRARDISWIPVCSTIPAVARTAGDRARLRDSQGVAPDGLLVALFSPVGSGKAVAASFEAWTAIAREHPGARLVVIGATRDDVLAECPAARDAARVDYAGFLDADAVSRLLSAADLFLAPFTGGISTRNTSAVAAMEHGLPIVTTRGTMTDDQTFARAPMAIVDAGDDGGFVDAAVRLARDPDARHRMATAIRDFHARYFDRGVVAARLHDVFGAAEPRS